MDSVAGLFTARAVAALTAVAVVIVDFYNGHFEAVAVIYFFKYWFFLVKKCCLYSIMSGSFCRKYSFV